MNTINAESTLVSVMNYLDPKDASHLRRTEKRMRNIMDSDIYWGEAPLNATDCFESLLGQKYMSHVSYGLTDIVMRSSYKTWKCISCGKHSDIPLHPFYGTVICKTCCETHPKYKIVGEKSACKKYAIGIEKLGDTPRIIKSQGVYRVLEHQVREKAESLFGKTTVQDRLNKSSRRSLVIHNNRLNSYNKRLRLLNIKTRCLVLRSNMRVDSCFKDADSIMSFAEMHNLFYFIIRDVLDFKVTSRYSIEDASEKLFDLACFLTCCRRNGIIMEDYVTKCPHHDDFRISKVFTTHCTGGIHFYEHIPAYMTSIERLVNRSKDVIMYTGKRREEMGRSERIKLYEILCIEEGIYFDTEEYYSRELDEYINHGVGDPVMIARECRKIEFLKISGYDDMIDRFLSYGLCYCVSVSRARSTTLMRCGQFPVMNRFCIDDRVPSRAN